MLAVEKYLDPDDQAAFLLGEDRPRVEIMGGAHDAAQAFDRALATWHPPIQSADADILPDKGILDARARDASRNDAFAQAGVDLHKDNIVGAQYMLNAKPRLRMLGLDEKWEEEFSAEIEDKFTAWAESPENWSDASRHNTFTAMIRLGVGIYVVAGEVLETAEWIREADAQRPYQTAFQMIELDRLCDPGDTAYDYARVRGGVELNSYGAPLAYYIRRAHGNSLWGGEYDHRWSRIKARNSIGRRQVLHVFEQRRPAQTRGISQLTAALKEMRITKRFRDIVLQNAVVNASFAAAIESELPTGQVFESLGGGDVGTSVVNYATQFLGAVQAYAGNARNMQIDGVKIPHLMPGTKLNMMPMGTPGGVGGEFEQSLLRYLSAGLGVSYEELSHDYSETNYSSARAGMLGTWRYMQSRKKMVADRLASMKYRLWFEEAVNAGNIEAMNFSKAPNIYDRGMMDAYTTADWIGASRGQIDELKETQAAILRISKGLSTYEQEIARMGGDWRTVLRQRAREDKEMEALGLDFSGNTDQENALSGAPREDSSEKETKDA